MYELKGPIIYKGPLQYYEIKITKSSIFSKKMNYL